MALLRIFLRVGDKNKIKIPKGIRKELDIKSGDKLELTVVGVNKARKLLIVKQKRRHAK